MVGVQVFRCSGVRVFRCSGVRVFGCSGVKTGFFPEYRERSELMPEHLNTSPTGSAHHLRRYGPLVVEVVGLRVPIGADPGPAIFSRGVRKAGVQSQVMKKDGSPGGDGSGDGILLVHGVGSQAVPEDVLVRIRAIVARRRTM